MGIINREGSLYLATGIDNSGLYTGRREAIGIIKAMAGQITSFDVFSGIGISAATAFASAAKSSYDFEKEFQKNMLEVATISTQVEGNMTDFMNRVMAITQEIPIKAPEAAKALYQIVSAGHDGADGMKVLEVSAKSAVGGLTDTATAADAITTILNAYKMSADKAEGVSDQLFTTVRLGKTDFSQLGTSIAQVAPIAAAYGISIDQVLGAVASLTKQGTPTSQAMTQVRAAIQGTAKELGDAAFQGRTFQDALQLINDKAAGSASKMKEMLGTDEGLAATLALTGKNAKAAASDLEELQSSVGATEAAFLKMKDEAGNQMILLSNNIQAALRPMGQAILKEVSEVAQAFNEAFENGDVERAIKSLGDLIVIVTGAFIGYKGAVTASTIAQNIHTKALVVSRLASMKHITTSALMTNAIKAQTVALLKNVAALATNPYVLAAAAVAALGYGLYKYATQATVAEKAMAAHNKRVKELSEWADKTKESVDGMLSSLKDENVLMSKKVEIYRNLQSLYPDELKNISLQNFLLMDSVQANNLLAKALDERVKAQQRADMDSIKAELNSNNAKISALESKKSKRGSSGDQPLFGEFTFGDGNELRKLKKRNEQLQIEFEKARDLVEQGLKDEAAAKKAVADLDLDNESGKTVLERKIKLTEELAAAEAKLKNLRAPDSTAKNSEIKTAEDKVKEIKGKLEALTGISGKEGDKLKQTQTELARAILDSELKLQAGRIAAMEDGKAKRIALAEQEYRETVATIQKEKEEYQKKIKETKGKEDPSVISSFNNRETAAGDKKNTDVAKVEKEYAEEYKQRTKALTDVFLSEEQRKLSGIKERYTQEKKWADEQLKTGGMTKEEHKSYTVNIDKAQSQETYRSLLDNLNDYKQKEKDLREKWDTDIAAAVEAKDAYLVSKLMEGKEKALSSLNSQMLQESSEWMRLFGNLDTLTVDELNKLIDSIQKQLDSGTLTLNPVDAKALMDSLNQAKEKVAQKNPFTALAKSSGEMKAALKELDAAEKSGLTGEQLDVYKKKVKDAADNVKKSISAIRDAYGEVSDVMRSAADLIGMVDEGLGETVNNAISLGDAVMNIGEVVANAVIAFANGMSTMESASVILLIIKAVLLAVMAAISLFNGDKKHEKKIKKLQEEVDKLKNSYDRLSESIEDAYSSDKADLIDKASENLRQQNELIQEQIKEEEDKKKTDKDKIKDWQNTIEENNRQIEKNSKKGRVEAIMGSDIKSAIDEFAQAYADAWASGEKAAGKSADIVKNLIRTSIIEMLKNKLKPEVEAFMTFLSGAIANDGIIDAAEQRTIDEWEKKLEGIADTTLAGKDKWLKDDSLGQLGITSDSISETIKDGLKGGKSGLKDFAGDFEDMMRESLINSLDAEYLQGASKAFYKKFSELSQSGGKLTKEEIEELRNMYGDMIEGARAQFDAMKEISGLDFTADSDNSLKGAYAKASEESIDLLAGQTGAVRVILEDLRGDIHPVRDQMRLIYDMQREGWQDVKAIRDLTDKVEKNTANVVENTTKIREVADKIDQNTRNTVDALEGTINVKVKM